MNEEATKSAPFTDAELDDLETRAMRAHRMTTSDPDDPARVTPYSQIVRLVRELREARS